MILFSIRSCLGVMKNKSIKPLFCPLGCQGPTNCSPGFSDLPWWQLFLFWYIVWSEMKNTDKWQGYYHFQLFFCHVYVHLSQNWGADSHFEVLYWSKFWLVLKLGHKTQIFPFQDFCDFDIITFCDNEYWKADSNFYDLFVG